MKHKFLYLFSAIAAAVCGLGLRLWNLTSGVDAKGLPVMELSAWLLVGCSALFLLVFLALAVCAPGRSGAAEVLYYGKAHCAIAYCSAILLLLSVGYEFGAALKTGASFSTPLILLLGLVSGFCLIGIAALRGNGKTPAPAAELIPNLYFIVKLVFDFRSWSTDPMILDYCPSLFALIFVVLAFYHSTGFVFSQGKPRRTLFYSMAAVYFSAVAAADGIAGHSFGTVLEHLGFLLWFLPIILCLLVPREPEPPAEAPESQEEAAES